LLVDGAKPPADNRAGHQQQLARLYHDCPALPIVLLTQLGERLALADKPPHLATVAKPIHASQLHDALVTVISGRPVPVRRTLVVTKLSPPKWDIPINLLLLYKRVISYYNSSLDLFDDSLPACCPWVYALLTAAL
jgi:hypothetical protein